MYIDDRDYLIPPDNEAKIMYKCNTCGGYIYKYEGYYDIYGDIYCEECTRVEFHKIAGEEYG